MPDDLVHAILPPPDLWKFRELTGVGDAELEVSFDGWSKLAILSADRVFLFPRRGRDALLLAGADTCETLAGLGLDCVPRVLERWPDGVLGAGPFVAFERRPGVGWPELEETASLEEFERMLGSLGGLIASWHRIDVAGLPAGIRQPLQQERNGWLTNLLNPARSERTVEKAIALLDAKPAWADAWRQTVHRMSSLPHVLVHGDVCENQLLVDDELRVRTVLDWDTAGLGNPLLDFDFGEWGVPIFRWEAEFPRLRRAMWDAYCRERGAAELPDVEVVNLLFTLSELAYFEDESTRRQLDDFGAARLALLRRLIGPATEAATATAR